jgi:hypothetical protein
MPAGAAARTVRVRPAVKSVSDRLSPTASDKRDPVADQSRIHTAIATEDPHALGMLGGRRQTRQPAASESGAIEEDSPLPTHQASGRFQAHEQATPCSGSPRSPLTPENLLYILETLFTRTR